MLWLTAGVLLGACQPQSVGRCLGPDVHGIVLPEFEPSLPRVSRIHLESWIEALTAPHLAGRRAGEPGAHAVAAALAEQMRRLGLATPPGWRGFCQRFPFLEGEDVNVVGHLPPVDDRADWILVGAHFDGQGIRPAGQIYPGADDNASGVAALLEIARLAGQRRDSAVRGSQPGWVFVALGAEEVGRLGASAFLERPSVELSQIDLMINLDMVGRPLPTEAAKAIGFRALSDRQRISEALQRAASLAGIEVRRLEELGPLMPAITDAQIFAPEVPTVLLSTGLHADHHELTDLAERIDYEQIERSVQLVLALADILADRP
ncbi:MAG: M20/M25/M40 family metallo-hydrolase [Acidobacteriota bacterium]